MRKKILVLLATACMILPLSSNIKADDFAGNEDYWENKCRNSQNSETDKNQCINFRTYMNNKKSELQSSLANLDKELASARGNAESLAALVNKYQAEIDTLNTSIAQREASITSIRNSIATLDGKIVTIRGNIEMRNDSIQERMIAEQPMLGTNMYIDFIMGAKDLIDLMRTLEGIQEITKNDQKQITDLKKDIAELNLAMDEQKRLEEEEKVAKTTLESEKAVQVQMKEQTESALSEYRIMQASIEESMRSVKVNLKDVEDGLKNSGIGAGDTGGGANTSGFLRPVPGSYITERPFYYSDGGVHLGVDYAVRYGTGIVAPANALVLYANNPDSDDNGYNLGNKTGFPAYAGNSILLLSQVNGTTYAIWFFHLRQANFYAGGRQSVNQGEIIAQAGSSGNSTGPHCHIEVINLGSMSLFDAASQFNRTVDSGFGTGWGYTAARNACENKGSAPCRERPENLFP